VTAFRRHSIQPLEEQKKEYKMNSKVTYYVLTLAISLMTFGCSQITQIDHIPDSPIDETTITIGLIDPSYKYNLIQNYEAPNKLTSMTDKNGKALGIGEQRDIKIQDKDFLLIHEQVKEIIRTHRISSDKSSLNKNTCVLSIGYGVKHSKIKISKLINLPFSQNSSEIVRLLETCQSYDTKQ